MEISFQVPTSRRRSAESVVAGPSPPRAGGSRGRRVPAGPPDIGRGGGSRDRFPTRARRLSQAGQVFLQYTAQDLEEDVRRFRDKTGR